MGASSPYNANARTREGVVYTPPAVADHMVRDLLAYWLAAKTGAEVSRVQQRLSRPESLKDEEADHLFTATVVDPAVGDGIFLHSLIRRVLRALPPWRQKEARRWFQTRVWGWDTDPNPLQRLSTALPVPVRLRVGDFLFQDRPPAVDMYISNPPYVRQERLSRAYKQNLRARFQVLFPDLSLSRRSDYYLYFLLAMLSRLAPLGVCTSILPTSWMETEFGAPVRELIGQNYTLLQLEASARLRHFREEVNTVIAHIQNRVPTDRTEITLRRDGTSRHLPHVHLQQEWSNWYGTLFRAPEWMLELIRNPDRCIPLSRLAQIRAGIITGNNRRYYRPQPESGHVPVIRSPREVTSLTVRENQTRWWLPTEGVPYAIRTAPLLWPDLRGERHFVVYNPGRLAFEHTFYGLEPLRGEDTRLALLLNSLWVAVVLEILGRTSLGGGAVRLVKADLLRLPLPRPDRIAWEKIDPGFLDLDVARADPRQTHPLRKRLDREVLEALGIRSRQAELHQLLLNCIQQRQLKARTIPHG